MENNKKTIKLENETYTNIRCFAEAVSRNISKRMGEPYEVKLQEVRKNNGVLLQGLIILSKEKNLSPTIYLNSFWEMYISGTSLERILGMIIEVYEQNIPSKSVDMSFFREFEKVRPKICYKLVNTRRNRALLEQVPHVELLDLSLCFYYAYADQALGEGIILIRNDHMGMWNCTTEMLMREAVDNTPRLYPKKLFQMGEIMREYTGEQFEVPMKVLTNSVKCNGATSIVYPGVLKEIAEQIGENLYILPSSIHEVILLPAGECNDEDKLKEMIHEVNRACVEPEEVLSDSLYFYDYQKNRLDNLSYS
ncbi:MAG: hypothetical protein IJ794_12960 [Lachnospiraceae bacterium]|nr:hypothetical protein [Lachnospiraceae bacterium]